MLTVDNRVDRVDSETFVVTGVTVINLVVSSVIVAEERLVEAEVNAVTSDDVPSVVRGITSTTSDKGLLNVIFAAVDGSVYETPLAIVVVVVVDDSLCVT